MTDPASTTQMTPRHGRDRLEHAPDMASEVSPAALTLARARLFVQPQLGFALAAHIFTLIGAIAISATVYLTSSLSFHAALLWPTIIAASNGLTIVFNVYNATREIPDSRLEMLAGLKTLCNALQGLAWGLGPQILNVPGEAVTVIAPAWAMVTGVSVLVFAAAPWPWSSFTFIVALFLPALVFLLPHPGPLEQAIGVAMLVSFPFALLIGRLGVNYVRDLLASRLFVDALLEREGQLTTRLKQLNAERTRFFSAASHDLRQPLQALGFYMTMLKTSGGSEDQREIVLRLSECAELLDRQFNAILSVASTDEAIESAVAQPTRLQTLLERVCNSVRPEAAAKGIDVHLVSTSSVASVPPELLERVLVNLTSNAVRYTERGRVLIGVRRRADHLEVCVADTGIGIAAHDLDRVFTDYFQVRNPERHASQGFGLGLGIVKRLCEGLGWPVQVRSTPGRGSIFSVLVPRATLSEHPEAHHVADPDPPTDLTSVAVVIVDDDPLVVDATSRLLRAWSVEHIATIRETEILELLAQRDHQKAWVVLLDYRLGAGPSGLEMADRVRAVHGSAVHVAMLTGEQDAEIAAAAAARNIMLLRKPLKPIQLRAALMNFATGLTAASVDGRAPPASV